MNDFLDPTNDSRDAELVSALQTLPEPPAHGADFWSSLEASLDQVDADPAARRTADPEPGRNGRTQFLLAAAALVIVAGIIGVAVNNADEGSVNAADRPSVTDEPTITTPEPTTETTTDDAPPRGDRPFVNTDGSTLVGVTNGFYVDEFFQFDLALPVGFDALFPSTRGAYLSDESDQEGGSIEIFNYLLEDDASADALVPFDDETLADSSTVQVPLYESINDSVERSDETIAAEQYVFDRQAGGQRIVRIVRILRFDDRVSVVQVTVGTNTALEGSLDDFRFYAGPLLVGDPCSTFRRSELQAPSELTPAQAARFVDITTALANCDWQRLAAQLNPSGFTASIAGDDAIELWQGLERYQIPVLQILHDHLALPVGIDETGEAQWPRGWATIEGPDDETTALLIESGYVTPEELPSWAETGYFGWRTGIDAEGNWNYFLVGD